MPPPARTGFLSTSGVASARASGEMPRGTRWLLAGLAALLIAIAYHVRVRDSMTDFAVNYLAGQRLAAGETLYQPADGHWMFKYFPSSALLYLPLSVLPIEAAKATWFVMSVLALVWTFRTVHQLVPRPQSTFMVLAPGLVLAKYFLRELRLGQINILVTLVTLLGVSALVGHTGARQKLGAGTAAGLAVALKPYSVVLFLYLIVKREWMSLAAGLFVLALALALPSFFYGVEGNVRVLREWAATLSQSTPGLLDNIDNVSVIAFFAKWTGDPARAVLLATPVIAGLALLMLAVIVRGGGRHEAPVLESAMGLTLIPLVSPLGWDYTFLMSLLAITLLVRHFQSFPRAARVVLAVNLAVIALAVYDLMGRQAYSLFMQWSITTVNFLIVVGGLAYLRFRNAC